MFKLCLVVGCPHPRYLKQWLNSRDIAEWLAYFEIEPFGPQHNELLAGIIATEIYNNNPWGSRAPAEPKDFMPSYEPEPEDWQSIRRNIQEWKLLSKGM